MKIGIISELNMHNANYGNRLQAFALNYFINNNYNNNITESLIFNFYDKKKITKITPRVYFQKIINKFISSKEKSSCFSNNIGKRIELANKFTKKTTKLCKHPLDWDELLKSDYDCFIVGSDVVWAQAPGEINRVRFLDFKTNEKIKRISYAASFGKNWIPQENKKIMKKFLDRFTCVSVRESNSVDMLSKIGINNAIHVCDPTLLLSASEWKTVEENYNVKGKYVFVYLLGKDKKKRDFIKKFAKEKGLKIINIPHANEQYDVVDENFGDIKLNDCSPGQWIYLIRNSEYFFTDSFHGTIFATIFNKKFIVFNRSTTNNINNRMENFLDLINEKDKYIDNVDSLNIDSKKWNYTKINKDISIFVQKSKEFLDKALL